MALQVPSEPKVKTTIYDNFKGVDYTNDSTNVWHRRSPSGVNMLPDASGRPFKRKGWEILLSQDDICTALSETECQIMKLAYFELAGKDHIVIFTTRGVLFYNGSFEAYSKEQECFGGYDRCFFFEGGGTSAFYIYGNFRIWRYGVDDNGNYAFEEVTDLAEVPTVIAGANALGAGQFLKAYNLIGQYARVEYNDIALLNYWCSDGVVISVDEATFQAAATKGDYYIWAYDEDSSTWVNDTSTGGSSLAIGSSGITPTGTFEDGMCIVIVWADGIMLPNNVSQNQVTSGDIKVWASTTTQFDTSLTVQNEGSVIAMGKCNVCTDPLGLHSWILFDSTDATNWTTAWGNSGEDYIRAEFPVATITTTSYTGADIQTSTDTADLDEGGSV